MMIRLPHWITFKTHFSLIAFALLFVAGHSLQASSPNPDLTAAGAIEALKIDDDIFPKYSNSYNLGPTGLRGWIYLQKGNGFHGGSYGMQSDLSRQILVTHVGTGTPASGVLQVDDVILGVGWGAGSASLFNSDCRKAFGMAIGEAEKTENGGILKLKIWRAGVTMDVQITLTVMGSYTDTAPYSCPKSAQILANAIPIIESQGVSVGFGGALNALAMMSTGNLDLSVGNPSPTAIETMVVDLAHTYTDNSASFNSTILNSNTNLTFGDRLHIWSLGYEAIFLAEYYLATGDPYVLQGVQNYGMALARSQSMYGTFGHRGSMLRGDGGFNGSVPAYGPVNSAGLPANIGIVLSKKAILASGGVVDPEINTAIDRASSFFGSYVNKGTIPYGEHQPWVNHGSNGKSGQAAVMFDLMGNKPVETDYYARMSIATHTAEEYGHTGQGFSYIWTALGANAGGAEAAAEFMKEVRWHRDLARRSDGSFNYDGYEQYGPSSVADYWDDARYGHSNPTAMFVLQYTMPLKNLYITGKDDDPAEDLNSQEVSNAIWSGNFVKNVSSLSTNDLVDALGEYDPMVRNWAAQELGERTGEHATLIPTLITMAEDLSDINKRQGACDALGYMNSADAVPALSRRLSDPDLWVRGMAARSLGKLGTFALPELTNMLTAFVDNALDPADTMSEDPLQFSNAVLCGVLFAQEPFRSEILNEDKALLYAAIGVGLEHPDGAVRANLSHLLKNELTLIDVQALAAEITEVIRHRSPADQMFSDAIRYSALETLAKHKIAEGVPLSLLLKEQTWMTNYFTPLDVLINTYGTAASEILPTLYDWQGYLPVFETAHGIAGNRYDNIESRLNTLIALLESDAAAPALKSFKSVDIISSTQISSNQILLVADGRAPEGAELLYYWSKVSGPGNVTFSSNATAQSSNTIASYDAPGEYVVRVTLVDTSIFDGGEWRQPHLGYVDFRTYEQAAAHLYGGVSSDETVVLDPATNWGPIAYSQEMETGYQAAIPLTLSGYDRDGDALEYKIITPPSNGSLSGIVPNLIYTPNPGYRGLDKVIFKVTAGGMTSSPASVSITVKDPLVVHVNIYSPDHGGSAALGTLSGPDGGASEVWNQFATTVGSDLLDAAGVATSLEYSVDSVDGWNAATHSNLPQQPLLPMLGASVRQGRIGSHNGQGYVTALRFNGLVPGQLYNISVASHVHYSSAIHRPLGEWSSNNPTTTAGPQMIDSRTAGINGDTWEYGVNYVTFENVEANGAGLITLLGDAANEGDYGQTYKSFLDLNGLQISEVVASLSPSAMSWSAEPDATGETSVTMTAGFAYYRTGVEYYFEETSGNTGGSDSGWQSSPTYTDTGLNPSTTYSYRVKARDTSSGLNENSYSSIASSTTQSLNSLPMLSSIEDDILGSSIIDTDVVSYTVIFTESLNPSTLTVDDFEITGSAGGSIAAVNATEHPAIFTVTASPNGAGHFRLRIKSGAVIEDMSGNAMDTASGIEDDMTFTVGLDNLAPSFSSISDNVVGDEITQDQSILYIVSFDRAIDASTVTVDDFEVTGTAGGTIENVSATEIPSMFAVHVSPDGLGTIRLQIKQSAVINASNGMALDTSSAIADDETYTVKLEDLRLLAGGNDSWNNASSWNRGVVPNGNVDAWIEAGVAASAINATTPSWNGALIMQNGSSLEIGAVSGSENALEGASLISMTSATIYAESNFMLDFPSLDLSGANYITSLGTSAHNMSHNLNNSISGSGSLGVEGTNKQQFRIGGSNTFSGGFTFTAKDRYEVFLNAAGSGGAGTLTVLPRSSDGRSAVLIINAVDALENITSLVLNGSGWNGSGGGNHNGTSHKIVMNADDEVLSLVVDGSSIANGSYSRVGLGAGHAEVSWISGNGVLTVGEQLSAYESWSVGFSGFSNSDTAMDFDGAGLPNGVEWVVGSDPTDVSDDASLQPELTYVGNGMFSFVYRRSDAAYADPNTSITVEYSSNLQTWSTAVEILGVDYPKIFEVNDHYGPGMDRVMVVFRPIILSDGSSKLYARLKVVVDE